MPASFRLINYSLRPAKSVERKMLCEGFGRLYPFQRVSTYCYVGFGSLYFSDFSVVHHLLGICDMQSFEDTNDPEIQRRFELNRPLKCIRMDFEHSQTALPKLDWSHRHIMWLDYDGALTPSILSDVDTVATRATSGTMFTLTLNVEPIRADEKAQKEFAKETEQDFDIDAYRLKAMRGVLGDKLPPSVTGGKLRGDDFAAVARLIVINEIKQILTVRNYDLAEEKKFHFEQVFNFIYSDGAKMLTMGGVFFTTEDKPLFEQCQFDELHFARRDHEPYSIKVPNLTPREQRHLNSQLPTSQVSEIDRGGVPQSDVERYAELYRYFPAYHEILFT